MNNSKHDTFLNASLIAIGVLGLLLAVLDGPAPRTTPTAASLVISEAAG